MHARKLYSTGWYWYMGSTILVFHVPWLQIVNEGPQVCRM